MEWIQYIERQIFIKKEKEKLQLLTGASFAGVEVRKNMFAISITCSGTSNRSLSPISEKEDKSATWSPCDKQRISFLENNR